MRVPKQKINGDRFLPKVQGEFLKQNYKDLEVDEEKENKYQQLLLMCSQPGNNLKTFKYQQQQYQESFLVQPNIMEEFQYLYNKIPQQKNLKIRKVCCSPEKILDAPDIVDDFYMNILDWGSNNCLAIGLSENLYVWNANNSQIEQLFGQEDSTLISAVHWISNEILSVGFENGTIQLIDVNKKKTVNKLSYHQQRVNSITSTWDLISSGGKDQKIINHDSREKNNSIGSIFEKHTQEVCGLKWQQTSQVLASGANDNLILLWDKRKMKLRSSCEGHSAAVKAMAWCPWQSNGLATGGGSNDRTIRFWNTDTNQCVKVIETGSQVCALQFLQKQKEMISSHGFSKFEIALWKAETLSKQPIKMQELSGHQSRVLHLDLSPDESMLCSASSDETLRFWRVGTDSYNDESPKKGLIAQIKSINFR